MRTLMVCVATLGLGPPIFAADNPSAIVDKAIAALGGIDNLTKFKAQQFKAKGTFLALGQMLPYTADYSFQRPNMFRFDMELEFGGQKITLTASTDGKDSWEKSGDRMQEMPKKKMEAFQHAVYTMNLSQIAPLKDKEYTLEAVDEIKIDDKPAIGVKVIKKERPDVTLYFDKKSSLPVKSVTEIWDEFTDKVVSQEVFMIGWKERKTEKSKDKVDANVSPVYFEKLLIKRDGKTMFEEEYSDRKVVEELDPKLFAKP